MNITDQQAVAIEKAIDAIHGLAESAEHLTCSEADALAEFCIAFHNSETAERLLHGHALGDDHEGDLHQPNDGTFNAEAYVAEMVA